MANSCRTLTENCGITFSTSSDPRVDFFFHITEDTDNNKSIELVTESWKTDPLDTLKLIAFVRDCRNGKGIRRQYHMSLFWLFNNHYQTLVSNLEQLVEFGYWKDLLHLLIILHFDGLIPDYLAIDDGKKKVKVSKNSRKKSGFPVYDKLVFKYFRKERRKEKKALKKANKSQKSKTPKVIKDIKFKQTVCKPAINWAEAIQPASPDISTNITQSTAGPTTESTAGPTTESTADPTTESTAVPTPDSTAAPITESAVPKTSELTAEEKKAVAMRVEELEKCRRNYAQIRYKSDEKYRKIYDKIVELFAKQLNTDLDKLSKQNKSISLAAKWAPTNRHHFDKYLFISGQIGRKLCELRNNEVIMNEPTLVANYYQREVCSPLRKYLKIPEVYMSANQWPELDYNRVASKCMQKNQTLFISHDKQRFEDYLASKKTISGAVLKPVELVNRGLEILDQETFQNYNDIKDPIVRRRAHSYFDGESSEEEPDNVSHETVNEDQRLRDDKQKLIEVNIKKEVLEKQWLSLTEDIKKKGGGLMENAIAVCDVSGSMNGDPMSAAIGLTILVMSLSTEPWNSLCITFHESPDLHLVDPNDTFFMKLKSLKEMSWGGTTNLNKVFELILSKATEQRLTQEQLPRLLLVFTDMQFNSAFPGSSLTNFEAAKLQFEAVGYKLPAIVFWNLRGNATLTSTPVQTNEYGAALLSGYSGQQLALILKTEDLTKMNAYNLMRSAIDNKRYDKLIIID